MIVRTHIHPAINHYLPTHLQLSYWPYSPTTIELSNFSLCLLVFSGKHNRIIRKKQPDTSIICAWNE